jgi:hypothetical protein
MEQANRLSTRALICIAKLAEQSRRKAKRKLAASSFVFIDINPPMNA